MFSNLKNKYSLKKSNNIRKNFFSNKLPLFNVLDEEKFSVCVIDILLLIIVVGDSLIVSRTLVSYFND